MFSIVRERRDCLYMKKKTNFKITYHILLASIARNSCVCNCKKLFKFQNKSNLFVKKNKRIRKHFFKY